MKKFYLSLAVLTLFAAWFTFGSGSSAQTVTESGSSDVTRYRDALATPQAPSVSTTLVLSQVSGGNGFYNADWIEIKNVSNTTQSLNGLSLYYGAATSGNFGQGVLALPNASLSAGQYYLVQVSSPGSGQALPVTPDFSGTSISMSGTSGKIGLVVSSQLAANSCGSSTTPCNATQLAAFVDWVAYGAAGNGSSGNGEGGTSVNNGAALTNTQGSVRKTAGCTDSDNNNADFDVVTNSVPRNMATALAPCSGGGTTSLSGFGTASPNQVSAGDVTLLTVTVTPATSPPSTGITVNGNLTSIGGAATQQFFDDGTNGDDLAGDNVFSYLAVIPANSTGGGRTITTSIGDAQSNTASATINFTVVGPPDPSENLALGNPSGATTDVNFPLNYLLVKTQYVMSYNRDRGEPNWVGWHLDSTWIGSSGRNDSFRPDPSLPPGWYQVLDTDYSGSGFDRGHHCPSGDRTRSVPDNEATFFMTNMMPQAPQNNQVVWADLENYCRTLAQSGNELYIYAGGAGQGGTGTNGGVTNTVANGHVVVPALTWKVIVVLPVGSDDAARVNQFTRVIAVIMPNSQSITRPWSQYRTSVSKVEALTGYNFFTNVRPTVRLRIKKRVDTLTVPSQ